MAAGDGARRGRGPGQPRPDHSETEDGASGLEQETQPEDAQAQKRIEAGWEYVAAGLRQVRRGGAIVLVALAAEGARVVLERASGLVLTAGTRVVRRCLGRLGRFRGP